MVSTSITSGRPNRTAVLCGFFNVSGLDIGMETAASAGVVPEVVFIEVVWETGFATIFGENDTETPLWMGKKMETEIPDAGLVIFENDDHFAYLHQWQRFTAVVRAFLK